MTDVPTIPTLLNPHEVVRRLGALLPPGWASEEAKVTPGAVLNALYNGFASGLSFLLGAPNEVEVTVGGAAIPGWVAVLSISNPNLVKPKIISHQVRVGETLADVAFGLANGIGADPDLTALGVEASLPFLNETISITYPTVPLNATWSTAPPPSNATTIIGSAAPSGFILTTFGIPLTTANGLVLTTALPSALEPGIVLTVNPIPAPQSGSLAYAASATRLQTALGGALDLTAADFLGAAGARYPGELDPNYRARVSAALLPSGATRKDVSNAVVAVTGQTPRIVEPWAPVDTGVLEGPRAIYFDVDTPQTPGRLTDPGLRYQGFIDTIAPTLPLLGGNSVPCYDDGFYYDVSGSSLFDFSGSIPQGEQLVFDAINRKKLFGTVAWVRFLPQLPPAEITVVTIGGVVVTIGGVVITISGVQEPNTLSAAGSFSAITAFKYGTNQATFSAVGSFGATADRRTKYNQGRFAGTLFFSVAENFSYGTNPAQLSAAGRLSTVTTYSYATNLASQAGSGRFNVIVTYVPHN